MIRSTTTMTQTPEQVLIERATHGDQAALSTLLEQHQGRLYNVILRMVSHRDDAAELTQDAMLKIIQGLGDFRGKSSISTWMIRIAMNLSISHLRKRRLRWTTSLDQGRAADGYDPDQSTPLRAQLADTREPDPTCRVQDSEQVGLLRAALERLSEEFRAVIVLRDIDQMDYQQVAQVLELPLGTVKSRLFRARLALRKQMISPDAQATDTSTQDPANPRPQQGLGNG